MHAQSCLSLCNPMDCSQPGSSLHAILQARILEWVAMLSSRESSQPRDQTHISYVPCIRREVKLSVLNLTVRSMITQVSEDIHYQTPPRGCVGSSPALC